MAQQHTAAPTVSSGRLDVFGRGTDKGLWHLWWNGSQWSGWSPMAERSRQRQAPYLGAPTASMSSFKVRTTGGYITRCAPTRSTETERGEALAQNLLSSHLREELTNALAEGLDHKVPASLRLDRPHRRGAARSGG